MRSPKQIVVSDTGRMQPLDTTEFRRIASEFTATEAWVVDGNYSDVTDIIWGRADTVVWAG